jgi:IclR family acetate operon transcriptional repressor
LPAYATGLGKVLLSGLHDDEILFRLSATTLESFTPHTVVDPQGLIAEIGKVRQLGYGMDYGEYTQGVICVAVPVFNEDAAITTAISVSVPEIRAGLEFQQKAVDVLTREAKHMSTVVGFSDSQSA